LVETDRIVALIQPSLEAMGYRLVRARQMAVQYGWLYRRRGPLGWSREGPVS